MFNFKKLIAKYLRDAADKIDVGTSEISQDQALHILSVIAHEPLSKEQACNYLRMKRSKFDEEVREGKIPNGRKRVGLKEKMWWRDELDDYLYNKSKENGK